MSAETDGSYTEVQDWLVPRAQDDGQEHIYLSHIKECSLTPHPWADPLEKG